MIDPTAHYDHGLAQASGVAIDEDDPHATQDLRLGGGVVIEGCVIAAVDGQPIEKAYVGLIAHRKSENGQTEASNVASLLTDARGEYRSFPLPYTRYQVSVLAPGFQRPDSRSLRIDDHDRRRRVDFELERPGFGLVPSHRESDDGS